MNIIIEKKVVNPEDLAKENPILPMKNMIFFPDVPTPVNIVCSKSLKLVYDVQKIEGILGVFCQKDISVENPKFNDLYSVGLVAQIINIIKEGNKNISVLLIGTHRVYLKEITEEIPYLKGKFSILETIWPHKSDKEFMEQQKVLKDKLLRILAVKLGMPEFVSNSLKQSNDYNYLANLAFITVESSIEKKQEILACNDLKERYNKLLFLLEQEAQLVEIKESIRRKTQIDINKQQKEYFLQQEMKNIQEALGGNIHDIEIKEIKEQAAKINFNIEQRIIFEKELKKLELIHQNSPDYSTHINYVRNIVSLPWNNYTKDNFNLARAKKMLDKDHFGLEKVKDRIIEYLAVLKLKGDMKSPAICLYGPPGVGKTSLGRSIANALGRKYFRMSLGGLHDEAEIRGHRKTYIGAMPGRIIRAIQKAGSSNPVIVLDEIDKVGNDYKGDPSAALLEVLDSEQNFAFHDNYLDIDFDLSKVLFIATANSLATISSPLLDRMELINVSSYVMEEKVEIALKHLLPIQLKNHGICKSLFHIPRKTMEIIIEFYTYESGVRELNKKIAKILRKIARIIADGSKCPKKITKNDLFKYLGIIEYTKDKYENNEYIGVVTGLAWTTVGGEILIVEAGLSKGKNAKLSLTGNLGNIMRESAILALEYIKSHVIQLSIPKTLENWNVHIHVPEGAIPKDGPSAGITMITALISAFTGRKVKPLLAMSGEITLRGKVLPVGGIKEKILAAKRAGIKEIILSKENQKHVDDIKDIYLKGLKFHYISDIQEVLDIALIL
ncbi:MAG: endopeptidase La [Bacteroidales bacterium OttesenSCG-928-I14]|nr:endopeptidase La [Bacteroidales bacterium OttesenSCG-928-I14]